MKKIRIYIIKNSNDNPGNIFFKENKNSKLTYLNNKYYFQNKNKKEIIDFSYSYLDFECPDLLNNLINIFHNSLELAKEISSENFKEKSKLTGNVSTLDSITTIISSKLYIGSYNKYESIFHFVSDIFCSILMKHSLENGNKRLALCFLCNSLRFFGFHFLYSYGVKKDYSKYEGYLCNLVKKIEENTSNNKSFEKFDEIVLEESKWIKNNCVIAIEFR